VTTKTEQLQIRVTPRQKAMLRRRARAAGLDLSTFVLTRALPPEDERLKAIVRALRDEATRRFALAELNDFLHACPGAGFAEAVEHLDVGGLTPYLQNYVAAMIEQAAHQKGVAPPEWTRDIAPLDLPRFTTPLASLRAHLLRASPVPFKRRNIFVDATVGDRV
jgi:uncharacterized protein (DUF1778 family)